MRSISLPLSLTTLGLVIAVACAAPVEETSSAGDAAAEPKIDASIDEPTAKDAGKTAKDAGKKIQDAGKADTGVEGDPCPVGITSEDEACGRCGTRSRVCVAKSNGGGLVWAKWGECLSEVQGADACQAGSAAVEVACGNCGKMQRVCGADCHYADGACIEPVFGGVPACTPGATEFKLGASCSGANEGRSHTCGPTCSWSAYGACELPPENPNTLAVNPTAGKENSKIFAFSASSLPGLLPGTCPTTTDSTSVSYSFVLLKNSTGKTAKVSVWTSGGGGAFFSNQMAAYTSPYAHVMLDDNQRSACKGTVNDGCNIALCNPDNFAGLVAGEGHGLSLAPGASLTIYTGADISGGTGKYTLHAKTESLTP